MKISIHSGIFHAQPLGELIGQLAWVGYDAIELNAETTPWAGPHVTPPLSVEQRDRIRQATREHEMAISSISAHRPMLHAQDAKRREAVEFAKGCIGLAVDVGTHIVHLVAEPYPDGVDRPQAWRWLVEQIDDCARVAQQRDVILAIEPHRFAMIENMADMQRLLDDLENDNLHVSLDPGPVAAAGEDPVDWIDRFGPLIAHVHVKDVRVFGPGEQKIVFGAKRDFECVPLGDGVVDWPAILDALRRAGYEGYLSVEYAAHLFGYNAEPWDRLEVAKQNYRFVDSLLQDVIKT